MGSTQPAETDRHNGITRYAFGFAIDGDLRFISHHDTLRLFKRAVARCHLPVRFSEGFNPQPRLMLPLPRPLGVASEDETLVIEFDATIDPDQVLGDLDAQTPDALSMRTVRTLLPKERLLPREVRYVLAVPSPAPADLASRVRNLKEARALRVERVSPKRKEPRNIDVRPYLAYIGLDAEEVEFTLRVSAEGTAKPAEIAAMLGFDAATINHRIRRIEVQWQ